MKKAVHFGAGKIGRGFIADLLHQSGYEITFVDVNEKLNEELNTYHNYYLYVIEENHRRIEIDHVSAVSPITEADRVVDLIVEADLVTTAVIVDNFVKIAGNLAKGLKKRLEAGKEPVNVIPCENAPYCGDMLVREIVKTGEISEEELKKIAYIPNTAVDRMVFAYEADGREGIEIGKDYELVIEKNRLVQPEEEPITGAEYTDNMKKYLERKLFVINGGHCAAGYLAHLKGFTIIQDYFHTEEGYEATRQSMRQTAVLIEKKHGFDHQEMMDYVDFALNRWATPGVSDEISRVSRAPMRKLKKADRMVAPALECEAMGLPNDRILLAIAAAFLYDVKEDEQSVELLAYVKENGIEKAVPHFTGIEADSRMGKEIIADYYTLKDAK